MMRMQPVIVHVPQDVRSEASVRQQALSDQQTNLVRRAVDLESRRTSLRAALKTADGPERGSLAQELREAEQQLAGVNASLSETRAKLSELQELPIVAEVPPVPPVPPTPPDGFAGFPIVVGGERMFGYTPSEFMGGAGFILLLPLVLAATRILWRRGNVAARPRDPGADDRLARLEQAVESVAIEIERIGESQRFNTRLLTERPGEVGAARVEESARPAGEYRR